MSWVTVLCSSVAAACLTLAAVHLFIWVRDRTSKANLGFSVLAVGVAFFTWCEWAMMRAPTADAFNDALRWTQVAIFLMLVGIVAFISFHFGTGRRWLAHLTWATRALTLAVNFLVPPNIEYRQITGFYRVPFLGEQVSVVHGETGFWHLVGQATLWMLLIFIVDASITLWRRGDPESRRRAIALGGSTAVFVSLGSAAAGLIFFNLVLWPHVEFVFFIGVVFAVALELGRDVLRSATLASSLQVSESEARALSGRLINAQEDERRRIARDLHDDLNQRLALVAIEMELLGRERGTAADERAGAIATQIRELSADVHKLSHQLHPAKLDQLGLVAAARGWCRDVTQQSGVVIEFSTGEVPGDLHPDVALCLYRLLQEASGNVVRHSGARSASVHIAAENGHVRLSVRDRGQGFAVDDPRHYGGLGLLGMKERVRLLKGAISIRSTPGGGTEVEATVPLAIVNSQPPTPNAQRTS